MSGAHEGGRRSRKAPKVRLPANFCGGPNFWGLTKLGKFAAAGWVVCHKTSRAAQPVCTNAACMRAGAGEGGRMP